MTRVTDTDKKFFFEDKSVSGDSNTLTKVPGKTLESLVNAVKARKDVIINDCWINTQFLTSYKVGVYGESVEYHTEIRGTEELSIYFEEVNE